MAWQVTPEWGFQPDLSKASEVEVRFSPASEGYTRIDLEHRHFERHGAGADAMRAGVSATGGWASLLQIFQARLEQTSETHGSDPTPS